MQLLESDAGQSCGAAGVSRAAFVGRRRLRAPVVCGIVLAGLALVASGAEPDVAKSQSVVVPMQIARGRVLAAVRINGAAPLSFMLDTGYTLSMINPQHAEALQLRRTGEVTIAGIAGDERAGVFGGATFDFAGVSYVPNRLASLPSDRKRQSRDGILGSGFFRRFVVEIDSRAGSLKLHEPGTFAYAGAGEVIALTFRRTTPIVQAIVRTPGGADAAGGFEIDTGCDGLCMGREFVEAHRLVPDGARGDTKQGVGGSARVRSGSVPQLRLGKLVIEKPAADFFLDGSPAGDGLAGHIGMEILRHYRIIFDYSRQRMILESYPAGDGQKR